MVYAAVLGFGTVGGGVVDLIEKNQEQIRRTIPEGLYVKYILDIREFPGSPYADRVVHDIDVILSDPEIKVICETMGGKEPACTFTRKALERGISVCTSNKELVAAFGPQLLETAAKHGCSYLFEASVGGGIPLLHPLLECLSQEKITSILGILNGTTNYILTKMEQEGADFDTVLKEAQALGYAERNPQADVEGHDAGRKICILSSLATGKNVVYENISVEGITSVIPEDFELAAHYGCTIKLLGVSQMEGENTYVFTAPFLVKRDHPLCSASDVFNAILVHGTMVDDVMFYGRGAGKLPTGSAVVSDMIRLAKNVGRPIRIEWSGEEFPVSDLSTREGCFYVRVGREDLEAAQALFETTKAPSEESTAISGEYGAVITSCMSEGTLKQKLEQLQTQAKAPVSWMRVL